MSIALRESGNSGSCAMRDYWGPVMPRRGSYFFLLVQAKVTKKKDTPLTAPSKRRWGFPALLAMPGGCATRTFRYAKPCSNKCSPTPPDMAVLLGGAQGLQNPSQHQWPIYFL